MSCDCERLAKAIYREIEKQLPERGYGDAFDNRDLHSVLIDGQLDLVKIAASLTRRFCVLGDDLATVAVEVSNEASAALRRRPSMGADDGAIPFNTANAASTSDVGAAAQSDCFRTHVNSA